MVKMNYSFRLKSIIVHLGYNDISFYLKKFTENIGIIYLMRSNRSKGDIVNISQIFITNQDGL